jgi:hypothetical protein
VSISDRYHLAHGLLCAAIGTEHELVAYLIFAAAIRGLQRDTSTTTWRQGASA